ncbi:MAG: DegV family protein [Bacillota bacterium]
MEIRLIVDSCCDLSPELSERIKPLVAPLTVEIIDVAEYRDDGTVDIPELIEAMRTAPKGVRSACPSPESYGELMRQCDECFVITISSKLSGSYNAACVARESVLEEYPDKKIHVCDSQTASAGQLQLALYLHECIKSGMTFEQILPLGTKFIDGLRTFFVLEDLGNLFRGGRLHKIAGQIVSKIALCPIMSDDGAGNIKFVAPALGMKHSLKKLVDLVMEYTAGAKEKSVRLILCFCNCRDRALELKDKFLKRCPAISDIFLIPTGALSTLYANNGGIIIAL